MERIDRVTPAQVAARAKVALANASKVMVGRADVRVETREHVRALAEELGYVHQVRKVHDRPWRMRGWRLIPP